MSGGISCFWQYLVFLAVPRVFAVFFPATGSDLCYPFILFHDRYRVIIPTMSQQRQHLNISREMLEKIADRVSRHIGRKLRSDEVSALPTFIQSHSFQDDTGLPLYGIRLLESVAKLYAKKLASPTEVVTRLDDLERYQHDEISHMTPDESRFKRAAYPIEPERGASLSADDDQSGWNDHRLSSLPMRELERIAALKSIRMADTLTGIFDTNSADSVVNKYQSYNLTYEHITLPTKVIQLDTRNSDRPYNLSNDISEFKWYVNGVSQGVLGQVGTSRVLEKLTQIIDLRVNKMYIPLKALVNKTVPSKFRLFVRNMFSQAVIVSNYYGPNQSVADEKMYHIELSTEIVAKGNNVVVELEPLSDFKLLRPFTVLEALTLQFLDEYETVLFEPDRGTYTVSVANPAEFISATGPHGLSTGDIVAVFNYNSTNQNLNQAMNVSAGLPIVKTSNTTFTVPIDTSAVILQNNVSVYYESKRVTMQLFFKGLEH